MIKDIFEISPTAISHVLTLPINDTSAWPQEVPTWLSAAHACFSSRSPSNNSEKNIPSRPLELKSTVLCGAQFLLVYRLTNASKLGVPAILNERQFDSILCTPMPTIFNAGLC